MYSTIWHMVCLVRLFCMYVGFTRVDQYKSYALYVLYVRRRYDFEVARKLGCDECQNDRITKGLSLYIRNP